MSKNIFWVEFERQRVQTGGDIAHHNFYEIALVYEIHYKLGIDTERVEAHYDNVVKKVLLARRQQAFGIPHVVDQDVERKADVIRNGVLDFPDRGLLLLWALHRASAAHRNHDIGRWLSIHLILPRLVHSLLSICTILVQEARVFFAEK